MKTRDLGSQLYILLENLDMKCGYSPVSFDVCTREGLRTSYCRGNIRDCDVKWGDIKLDDLKSAVKEKE